MPGQKCVPYRSYHLDSHRITIHAHFSQRTPVDCINWGQRKLASFPYMSSHELNLPLTTISKKETNSKHPMIQLQWKCIYFQCPVTYDSNDIHCYNDIIQWTLTLLRYKLIWAPFSIAQRWIERIPFNSCFTDFLAKAIRSELLQNWLFEGIGWKVCWIRPIEKVNV